ncbi:Haloacid dehalogenase-like hydrolase (HAD) superfamily protein [Zea mays]|uniref:Haloacid dehalogenase-like hydrolase (HAD) superfamily protein n=1 Tax=Zea mays TaxID=4577 RepID=A0A1D6IZG3_MAIZE|nr:Haloacid dehalogenase-like hydrolase (HAD) superfamily protein [Zea mays]
MHSASGLSVCRMFVTIPCGSWMDHCFFQYYAHGDAWRLPTGADAALRELKDAGDLELFRFDAIVVSSEVGYEKPSPEIFNIALDQIGVEASKAIHVGDDETADMAGANATGLECWLWGKDVTTFSEIQERILTTDGPQ